MALNVTPLGHEKAPDSDAPRIYSESYRSTIVESVFQPEQHLLTQAPGTPRLFRYFRQHIRSSDEAKEFQPGKLDTYQSYVCIDKMIVKQEGDGSFQFDPDKGESSKTYSGYMAFGQPPLPHDVLITDIGNGRAGIFGITNQPEIRAFTNTKAYYITYVLRGILDQATEEALERRTVDRLVYSKDSALHGGASVITHGEEDVGNKLFGWNATIASNILRNFYWASENTISLERSGTVGKIYDPGLVNFISAFITADMRGPYPPIQQFSVQYGGLEKSHWGTINIWEVLLRGDMNLFSQCKPKATLISIDRLLATRNYGNLSSSKFLFFVATNPEDYIAYSRYATLGGFPDRKPVDPGEQKTFSYIFSEGFYKGVPEGEFENLLMDVLKTKIVDHKRLLKYCESYFSLPQLDQLYHGAILLMLLKLARRLGGYF